MGHSGPVWGCIPAPPGDCESLFLSSHSVVIIIVLIGGITADSSLPEAFVSVIRR
jgi:hypothetical protein